MLLPGLPVLRPTRTELQIGLRPGRQVRLPDTAPVRRTLDRLLRGETPPPGREADGVLAALAPVLVDGAGLLDPRAEAGDVAAAALRDPSGYTGRLAARHATTVTVRGTLGVPAADPRPLLRAAGVRTVEGAAGEPQGSAAVTLLLCVGDVDRAELDPLLRRREPHLLVRLLGGDALVGPFVVPGRTACLRCLDAHEVMRDPRSAALRLRHPDPDDVRADGVAEPVDTALATIAVAWAVRDLVSMLDGELPSSWSATVRLTATLSPVTQTEWRRHPACGCSWLPDEQLSSTMGA